MEKTELLTYTEVSEFFKVSRSTICKWVHEHKFPEEIMYKMPGKKATRRFIKSKLEAIVNGSL